MATSTKNLEIKAANGSKKTKRGPDEMTIGDHSSRKRRKMDQCFLILERLMTHPYGRHFNQPVDPVALNIPTYFSVISKPMDLGTIKSKLVKDLYATTDQFEADIKLTFSNAMQYNPACSPFHKMAQQLDSLFSAHWRFLGSRRSSAQPTKKMYEGSKEESARKVEEENQVGLSKLSRTSGGATSIDSDYKVLRVEMLKKRFACIILKAQKQTHPCTGGKRDRVKMEEEKQRLERQEAEAKASRSRDDDRKMQRQREREAARKALEKVEKTAEFEDNISILREFAYMMEDFSFAGPMGGYGGMYAPTKRFVNGKLKSPLERLGLYLREDDDYMIGDDQSHDGETLPEDYEEGEIIF